MPAYFHTLLVASLALPAVLAVTLDDFTPRASNLPSACQTVYTSDINGCQASDFTTGTCSQSCLLALNELQTTVSRVCQGVTGDNVLVAFMEGYGTADLCKNADSLSTSSTQATSTSTTSVATSKSTQEASTTSSAIAATTSSTLSTSTVASSTASATSSSAKDTTIVSTATVAPVVASTSTASGDAGTSLAYATTSAPSVAASVVSSLFSAESHAATSTTSSTSSQATSGGSGSPFDTYTDSSSSAVKISSRLYAVVSALGVAAAVAW